VLAFGDSLTFGYGVSREFSYPAVLAQQIQREVINAGISGEISADGLKRLSGALDRWRPELVIICHGGNDVLRRMDARQTEANLRAMINLVRGTGAEVVLIAVPKFGLFPKAAKYYSTIADDTGVPIEMDVLAELVSDNSKKSDQVHLNQAGYRDMALAVEKLMAAEGAI
jgi:lysophospholipase L1-like esterase